MPAEADTKRLEPLYTLPQQSQVEIAIYCHHRGRNRSVMAHGNMYFARLVIPVNRQPQRLPQLASHLGREHDVGHAVGIVKYFDTRPRKIVKRVRIGNVAIAFRPTRNRLAPRLEEGLLARPAGRKMHRLAIPLDLHPLSGLPSLARGEQVSHARPRFAQLLGERRHIHDIMPQTQHFPAFRKFSGRSEPCRLPHNKRATLRFHARIPSYLSASSSAARIALPSFHVCTSENTAPNGSRADGK